MATLTYQLPIFEENDFTLTELREHYFKAEYFLEQLTEELQRVQREAKQLEKSVTIDILLNVEPLKEPNLSALNENFLKLQEKSDLTQTILKQLEVEIIKKYEALNLDIVFRVDEDGDLIIERPLCKVEIEFLQEKGGFDSLRLNPINRNYLLCAEKYGEEDENDDYSSPTKLDAFGILFHLKDWLSPNAQERIEELKQLPVILSNANENKDS